MPIVTIPFVGVAPTVTVALVMEHAGRPVAPAGEEAITQELIVMVPVYPPLGIAVMVDLPVAPTVSVTGLAERVYAPSSTPVPDILMY